MHLGVVHGGNLTGVDDVRLFIAAVRLRAKHSLAVPASGLALSPSPRVLHRILVLLVPSQNGRLPRRPGTSLSPLKVVHDLLLSLLDVEVGLLLVLQIEVLGLLHVPPVERLVLQEGGNGQRVLLQLHFDFVVRHLDVGVDVVVGARGLVEIPGVGMLVLAVLVFLRDHTVLGQVVVGEIVLLDGRIEALLGDDFGQLVFD